jgi:hypothetical protein
MIRASRLFLLPFSLVLALSAVCSAESIICDLSVVSSCTINGAIFATTSIQPAGTGVIDSFVRIQNKGTEQGYNTSYRAVQFDEKKDPNHTRDLQLSEVGTTIINGAEYATFYLDINEPGADPKQYLTLDQLEVFTTSLPNRTGYEGIANTDSGSLPGTGKIYDLDAGGNNSIQLSYNLFGGGSGKSDMVFYLPISLFTGTYVNLFSQFGSIDASGNTYKSEAGFEEWFAKKRTSTSITAVPEPGTIALVSVGLLRLRRRRANA